MIQLSLKNKILLGRLLTRSGDQAWDFAVPLVLLQVLPNQLRYAALYYLIIKLATVFLLPSFTQLIDKIDRLKALKTGLLIQLIGVVIGFGSLVLIQNLFKTNPHSLSFFLVFILLIVSGLLGQLGSIFSEISVANDIVPTSFKDDELSEVNSKLRQVDLFTEVVSPIATGALLLLSVMYHPLFGFLLVAFWNTISFFPEYFLLKSVFRQNPDLKNKLVHFTAQGKEKFFDQLHKGWKSFFKQPVAGAAMAYALLWLSVLSPHGVLLTAFLKDAWQTPEWIIGVFRGAGALFGLAATLIFPLFVKKLNVDKASLVFLSFQFFTLFLGLLFFINGGLTGQTGFLILILLSRIGLYGFSLGEMQLRQTMIAAHVRGEVNGFANALTVIATIILFTAAVVLPTTADFKYLVMMSVFFVFLALVIFIRWFLKRHDISNFKSLTDP